MWGIFFVVLFVWFSVFGASTSILRQAATPTPCCHPTHTCWKSGSERVCVVRVRGAYGCVCARSGGLRKNLLHKRGLQKGARKPRSKKNEQGPKKEKKNHRKAWVLSVNIRFPRCHSPLWRLQLEFQAVSVYLRVCPRIRVRACVCVCVRFPPQERAWKSKTRIWALSLGFLRHIPPLGSVLKRVSGFRDGAQLFVFAPCFFSASFRPFLVAIYDINTRFTHTHTDWVRAALIHAHGALSLDAKLSCHLAPAPDSCLRQSRSSKPSYCCFPRLCLELIVIDLCPASWAPPLLILEWPVLFLFSISGMLVYVCVCAGLPSRRSNG